jgi:hypothetical protein
MWDALDKGDIPSVFRYLILGADPNRYSEKQHMSLLMKAIDMENLPMVELALMWMDDIKGWDDK